MSRPLRIVANLVAVGLLVATGVVHGRWTGRWVVSHDLEVAVARLSAVPDRVGDWTSSPLTLDSRQIERGGIAGYIARRYEARGQRALTILLVCGPPGPIAVHSPEVCYSGAGYDPEAFPVAAELDYGVAGKPARLLEGIYRKKSATGPDALRVCWTFHAADGWNSPPNPRLAYATERALYKLYVIQDLSSTDESRARATVMDFTRQLLPALDKALSPSVSTPSPTKARRPL